MPADSTRKPRFPTVVLFAIPLVFTLASTIDVTGDHSHELSDAEAEAEDAWRLNGVSFRCCAVFGAPYVTEDPWRKSDFDGWAVQNFEKLQHLTGFTCSSLKAYGTPEGKSKYNEFIERLENCTNADGTVQDSDDCQCEIGIGSWLQNPTRTGVDFLPAHGQEPFTVVVDKINTHTAAFGAFFITAFSKGVWLAIAGLVCCFFVLKMKDPRFARRNYVYRPLFREDFPITARLRHFLLRYPILYRARRAFQSASSRMVANPGLDLDAGGAPRQWLLNFIICVSSLFLLLSYEAVMTAGMVRDDTVSDFHSIEDLKSCRIKPEDVCFTEGDGTEVFWNNMVKSQDCWKGKDAEQKVKREEEANDIIELLRNRKCKFMLAFSGVARRIVNGKECEHLTTTGEPFLMKGLSFVVPRNWNNTEKLRRGMLELQQRNAMLSIEQYVEEQGACPDVADPYLGPKQLYLFFVMVAVACSFILLEMLVDRPNLP